MNFTTDGDGPSAKRGRKTQKGIPLSNGDARPPQANPLVTREMAERLGIPKRWKYCPPMGKVISGFLPVKTPLSQLYDACLPDPQYRFYPSDVFKYAPTHSDTPNVKIGMWIDLTKTDRYYSRSDVEDRGAKYVKMPLAGHGESPSREDVNRFIACVREYRKDHADDLIVVHCTHGFNRTGFLICAYMFQEEDFALDYAAQSFTYARPDGIYKEDYLQDLQKMFSSDEELPCPGRPAWENEDNPPLNFGDWKGETIARNGTSYQSVPSTSTQAPSLPPQPQNGKPVFMEGKVPMARFVEDTETVKYLRSIIKDYCSFKRDFFPGSQPVSLERTAELDNLSFLANEDYMVSWKADGMRYLVLIFDDNQIYAFDRDNNVFELGGISFPHRKHNRHIKETLVDAEMVIDHIKVPDQPDEIRPRLLIYDIVKFEDTQAGQCDFRTRFACIQRELIDPLNKALSEGRIQKGPMGIRRKDFYEIHQTHKLFRSEFMKMLGHETDGLIFQPVKGPYVPGRYDKLLKWKPQDQSTIDFKLKIVREALPGQIPEYVGNLYVLHLEQPFAKMKPKKADQPYDGKIVECKFENRQWKIMRERTDKSFPNAYETAKAVWRCILSPITTDVLLSFIRDQCRRQRPQ